MNQTSAFLSRWLYPPIRRAPASPPPTSRITFLSGASSSGTSPPTCVGASAVCRSKWTVTPAPSSSSCASRERMSGFVWSRSKKCTSLPFPARESARCTASSDLPQPASPRKTAARPAGSPVRIFSATALTLSPAASRSPSPSPRRRARGMRPPRAPRAQTRPP